MFIYDFASLRLLLSSLLVIASAFMSPAAESATDKLSHTLSGFVWMSPICAGAQKENDPCRGPMTDVEVRLSDSDGRVRASAKTDEKGAFVLSAPTGLYKLHVHGVVKIMHCSNLAITLPMTKPATAELECDSGMR